jgi:hypothetical protein
MEFRRLFKHHCTIDQVLGTDRLVSAGQRLTAVHECHSMSDHVGPVEVASTLFETKMYLIADGVAEWEHVVQTK